MLSPSAVALVNRVRAYERAVRVRERALARAEKMAAEKAHLGDKAYALEFNFDADAAGTVPQAQTKSFTVDSTLRWFLCKNVFYTLSEVGTANETAVNYTVNPLFRPFQISGTIDIRDSYRDRAWSNVPLPDAFYAAQNMAGRALQRPTVLPGGTEVSVTYAPISQLGASSNSVLTFGFTPTQYRVVVAFHGIEVRDGG